MQATLDSRSATVDDPAVGGARLGGIERLLFLCFFLSGASGLVYEVVWLRWLVHLFGATSLAVSTVLTAFMAGLAFGSSVGGHRARRIRRPLFVYGLLELAIGAYALLLPVALQAVVPTLRVVGADEASSFLLLSLARFALATLVLTVPTACMGATLPVLVQFAVPRLRSLAGPSGALYAVNTAGAVVGTGAAGLVLLPAVGAAATNWLAVGLNLAVGLAALAVSRRVERDPAPAPTPGMAPAAVEGLPPGVAAVGVAACIAALAGALALVAEVVWTRALALILGSSVYAFTVMLVTFLVGLAVGSAVCARRVERLRAPGVALAALFLLAGLATLAGLVALAELPYLFLRLFGWTEGRHGLMLGLQFVVSAALVLAPAACSGAVFPLCVRLAGGPATGAGRTVGTLYAANTVGAIVGSFAGGFVLLPTLGIRGTLLTVTLLELAVAAAVAAILALPTHRRGAVAVGALAVSLAVVAPVATPAWDAAVMMSGVAVYAPRVHGLTRRQFDERSKQARLLLYEEGLTTTVSVEESRGGVFLRVNGKVDASTGVDMPTQVLAGHLPILVHPKPREALVIGLGSGVSVGSILRHPLDRVTVVELERAVITASRFFEHVNGRPLGDPRARLVVNDARNFLLLGRTRFDVIVSEPSNPWVTGASSLFTRDFFTLARDRLRPGGVFGQWLQLYSLSPELLRTVIATFQSVFPHTLVFQTVHEDTLLIGSATPLSLDLASIEQRMAVPAVATDLARVGIRDSAELLGWLALDTSDVPRFARGAEINTDDNARLEFAAPRALYEDSVPENLQRLTDAFGATGDVLPRLAAAAPPGFPTLLAERYLARGEPRQAQLFAEAVLKGRADPDLQVVVAEAAEAQGNAAGAARALEAALALDPGHPRALLALAARHEAAGAPAEARTLARRAAPRARVESGLREAWLDYKLGEYRAAADRLAGLPADRADVARVAGLVRLALGQPAAAEPLLRAALAPKDDAGTRAALAAALDQLSRPAEARQERQRAVRLEELDAGRLRRQARVRAALGHLAWAAHDLARAIELSPANLDLRQEHARLLERAGDRRAAIVAWEATYRAFPDHALALLEVAVQWEALGNVEEARQALRRYVAAETSPTLRARAEVQLQRMDRAATPRAGG
jgi:spermidine synthase